MSDARKIPPATLARQALASDPDASAWVSANAGSGKTHVLAQRVIRLLLAGTPPGRILCLTFTKAAAANMAERVFKNLSAWTALDDEALASAIEKTGAPRPRGPHELAFARKLFARAVETPGGLKIQTLHAFCERVLHAAPFEANVAAGFSVIEEVEQADLIARARQEALAHARRDPALAAALERVAEDAGLVFDKLLDEALRKRAEFRAAAAPGAEKRLAFALGLAPGQTTDAIARDILEGGLEPTRWLDFAVFLASGLANDNKRGALFAAAFWNLGSGLRDAALEKYLRIFFKQTGDLGPVSGLLSQGLAAARPDLLRELQDEQARLIGLRDRRAAASAFERTRALNLIVNAILARYETLKSERQSLDFDDLVVRAKELLSRSSARWVLQKLDAGIEHILVDEAQDTSAAQWDILDRVAGDFFAGHGQNSRPRSFFAVGDEKQSIFSFQGAAPALFASKQAEYKSRSLAANKRFEPVQLTLSFRSAPGVLAAVDKVFKLPEHFRGLSAQDDQVNTVHEALKSDAPSRVEIWDVIAPGAVTEKRDWKLPLDFQDETDPPVAAARRIARTIARWLQTGSGETVEAGGTRRPIRPGDIMILVRRRDAFFEAMIRALKEQGVPVAGADRLKLTEHIAVMDLVAIGRAALLPQDDLTLATVLKTPLFGLDDDDLIALAPERTGSLHAALQASGDARVQAACAQLDRLSSAARAQNPFAFYARLLGPLGGRRAFLARLGPEAGDALDEFLNLALAHERARAPSLTAFLSEIQPLDVEVKRDMDTSDAYVRVMTAHAAKGLEGKIVFLPDVCAAPGGQHDGRLFPVAAEPPLLAWSPKKSEDCNAIAQARAARREAAADEYRRLLYVVMTRAEERLVIAGHRGQHPGAAGSWRAMLEAALAEDCAPAPAHWNDEESIQIFGAAPSAPCAPSAPAPAAVEASSAANSALAAPDWLFSPAPAEASARPPIRPSSALEGAEDFPVVASPSPQRAQAPEEGRLLHRLLQFLPDLAAPSRRAAALRDLAAHGLAPERAEKLAADAVRVLDDLRLAPLFGPESVAEARIAAKLDKPGGGFVDIAGAIDRLAETPDAIWLADYKTGAVEAATHVAQIALYRAAAALLYPGRRVRCFLIFTTGPRVEEIPDAKLDAALADALKER